MYAILDLETTGGKYNEEGITEVAIYKFDGREIVDQFISLVNPERPIQAFVVGLTGINNQMLRNAPKFYEVAKRIIEITQDCIIVAHNAQFDYRILQLEFDRLGYDYQRKSLCTVELAQELLPDQESYSLGKLARNLGIPVTDRHRANGDALATVKLFKILLAKDTQKKIIQESVKLNPKKQLDTKLRDLIEEVPSETGVFYMHNANGRVIYIGKSRNMKKQVNQHFTSDNKKSKRIQDEVEALSYDETGSELVALLKENEEVKKIRPYHNKSTRRARFKAQLVSFLDADGYLNLKLEKADRNKACITTFATIPSGLAYLQRKSEEYELCPVKTGLEHSEELSGCEDSPEVYNQRVQNFIDTHTLEGKNKIIIDRGPSREERSAILIENGQFKGLGYYNLNHQITNLEILERIITTMQDTQDARHIIQSYLRNRKVIKIIELEELNNTN
ncbi:MULTISPECIES: exonuclease domain-containing protein [unclassified Leeuwenhoekiella]|uniref:exonuclease domain-containing protein n=1 Tax=unclassified Leeuwenhoekiella TaxID=2615029 RepID=UPI000C542186|nr:MULTISPECIES: exonuclease domain-containing protein [unclassified Leeuwenhoekiella]MAW94603.1 exonuclease [Leeuwenhoekiella sp.]MBA82026.1 exonuclease [Leeuwenhoekiella sp.]|tara:strand:- start:684 stop:2030 length:1347 start_codon:yes stop_codon:yes gene_type:complete